MSQRVTGLLYSIQEISAEGLSLDCHEARIIRPGQFIQSPVKVQQTYLKLQSGSRLPVDARDAVRLETGSPKLPHNQARFHPR